MQCKLAWFITVRNQVNLHDFIEANYVFMQPYLGPPWTDFHKKDYQIWVLEVLHHALTINGILNAEMQKKKKKKKKKKVFLRHHHFDTLVPWNMKLILQHVQVLIDW